MDLYVILLSWYCVFFYNYWLCVRIFLWYNWSKMIFNTVYDSYNGTEGEGQTNEDIKLMVWDVKRRQKIGLVVSQKKILWGTHSLSLTTSLPLIFLWLFISISLQPAAENTLLEHNTHFHLHINTNMSLTTVCMVYVYHHIFMIGCHMNLNIINLIMQFIFWSVEVYRCVFLFILYNKPRLLYRVDLSHRPSSLC